MSKKAYRLSRKNKKANLTTAAPLHNVSLLLAGGDGTRLQDLTREVSGAPIPKQYCRLLHGASLLEATLSRAHLFSPRNQVHVIINQNHLGLAKEQLKLLPDRNVFVQPLNRDTGPGLLYSILQLEQLYPDAIVAAFPTDHYVDNDKSFIAHTLRAAEVILNFPEKIAILGIAPDRPETGYGYILPAETVRNSHGVFHVTAFLEKPDLARAQQVIAQGGLWNTFVMVFRLSRMIELLKAYVPDEFDRMAILRDCPDQADGLYDTLSTWNLSKHFLARIPEHLITLEVSDVGWSDWGTRESIERTFRSLNMVPFWNMLNPVPNQLAG
jgi:mannose-1-phosphate guanylyltransferase